MKNPTFDAFEKALKSIDRDDFKNDGCGAFHAFMGYLVGTLEADKTIDQYEAASLNTRFAILRQRFYEVE